MLDHQAASFNIFKVLHSLALMLLRPHVLEILRSSTIRFWNQTWNQKYNYNLARSLSFLMQCLQGLTLLSLPFWNQTCNLKIKLQSMLYHQAALFNVFKVLHSLAHRFWNQICNQKIFLKSIFSHTADPAIGLRGLLHAPLAVRFWNQIVKLQSVHGYVAVTAPCLGGLMFLSWTVLKPNPQPTI